MQFHHVICIYVCKFLIGRTHTECFSSNFRNRIISLEDSIWKDLNKLVKFYMSIHSIYICREPTI